MIDVLHLDACLMGLIEIAYQTLGLARQLMDNLHTLGEQYGADFVSMVTDVSEGNGFGCGIVGGYARMQQLADVRPRRAIHGGEIGWRSALPAEKGEPEIIEVAEEGGEVVGSPGFIGTPASRCPPAGPRPRLTRVPTGSPAAKTVLASALLRAEPAHGECDVEAGPGARG
jgi:hypothetical protein